MMRVIFHPEAKAEMAAAARYYERSAAGVGEFFLQELRTAINLLKSNPLAFPEVMQGAKKMILSRFPFSIFYTIKSERLIIMAVSHQHRRSGYWKNRL